MDILKRRTNSIYRLIHGCLEKAKEIIRNKERSSNSKIIPTSYQGYRATYFLQVPKNKGRVF
jgi:hypothetical protein